MRFIDAISARPVKYGEDVAIFTPSDYWAIQVFIVWRALRIHKCVSISPRRTVVCGPPYVCVVGLASKRGHHHQRVSNCNTWKAGMPFCTVGEFYGRRDEAVGEVLVPGHEHRARHVGVVWIGTIDHLPDEIRT
jgi:hypothetical protein